MYVYKAVLSVGICTLELKYVFGHFSRSPKRENKIGKLYIENVVLLYTKEFIHLRPKERFICPLLYSTVAKSMDLGWGDRVNPRPESTTVYPQFRDYEFGYCTVR